MVQGPWGPDPGPRAQIRGFGHSGRQNQGFLAWDPLFWPPGAQARARAPGAILDPILGSILGPLFGPFWAKTQTYGNLALSGGGPKMDPKMTQKWVKMAQNDPFLGHFWVPFWDPSWEG